MDVSEGPIPWYELRWAEAIDYEDIILKDANVSSDTRTDIWFNTEPVSIRLADFLGRLPWEDEDGPE